MPDTYFFLDNQFLAELLQGGVVGLTAFVALLLIGIGTARGVRSRAVDPELRSLGQALAGWAVAVRPARGCGGNARSVHCAGPG